jgi:hypothetical protein
MVTRRPGERLTSAEAVPARIASAARWEVRWSDWRGHHDWIGRKPARRSVAKAKRRKPPPVQHQLFESREGAEAFVAKLRTLIPTDELAVQVVDRHQPKPSSPAKTPLFPGVWPIQFPP